jgi:hypothetical protein
VSDKRDLLKELQEKLDYADQRFYDSSAYEDADNIDEDTGEYKGSTTHAFAEMYSGYLNGDYKATPKPFTYNLPGAGPVEVVDDYDDHDDGHSLHVVFHWNGHFFQKTGWDDSWSGDGGWEGPLVEVKPKRVTTTVWSKV